MAETTGISWCDSTFNPWIGCTKVSPGCDHCYAEALDKRHKWGGATHWGAGVKRHRTADWSGPVTWNKRADRDGKRHLVFCASLADVFDNEVHPVWRSDLSGLIASTPNLTWLLLTKRIGNAANMNPEMLFYPNVWLGASIVNQEEADRDIPKLLATPAAKRFVSYEPALGPVDWRGYIPDAIANVGPRHFAVEAFNHRLDWIIVGGESNQGGAKARPFDIAWARSTVQQCKAAGVPVFVKQLGSRPGEQRDGDGPTGQFRTHQGKRQFARTITALRLKDRAGANHAEWPEDLRVQEFPA